MKNIFFICMFATVAFTGCVDDDDDLLTGEVSPGVEILPENKPNEVVDSKLFEIINLDYPGLEKVKKFYESGEYYYAANELLEYYRTRVDVNNPSVNLINPTISEKDQRIADQALEHRFYVKGFAESVDEATKLETYYSFYDASAKKIDWSANEDKQKKEQEFRYQLHRHQWMLPQAKAYRISKDEKYIQSWIEAYGSWIETFPYTPGSVFPPAGGSENDVDYQWKGLQVAERVLSQVDIMPYFIHSTNFTPEWLSTFLVAFEKEVECIRLNYYQSGNILISQYQAVATAGILMPEFKNASTWATEGTQGLNESLDTQFNDDGVEYELDFSYHTAAISDFREIYLIAQANNKTNLLSPSYISKLKKATEFVMDMIYPNYTIDNFNDTRSASYAKSTLLNRLKEYSAMYPDDNGLLWVATEGKSGSKPSYTTKAYSTSGYYMLRNGWDKDATMMILKNNYNPTNQWHCQPDNGTFGLYRKERNFFPDAGVFTYNTGAARSKYASTVNHNTMTIMSKTIGVAKPTGQGGVMEGKMIKLTTKNNVDILVTENQQSDDITHRRTVFFVNNRTFFVVVDEGYGASTLGTKTNINFHLLSDKDTPSVFDKNLQTSVNSNKYYQAYTNFDSNNILAATFTETSQDLTAKALSSTDVTNIVSTNTDKEDGPIRLGYQITLRQPKITPIEISATRYITILCPFESATEREELKVDAKFTDNEDGTAGTFHSEGVSIQVTVKGTVYDLSSK